MAKNRKAEGQYGEEPKGRRTVWRRAEIRKKLPIIGQLLTYIFISYCSYAKSSVLRPL